MIKILITFAIFAIALDALDRQDCTIWSTEPGDEICESCSVTAPDRIELANGSVVVEPACQEMRP